MKKALTNNVGLKLISLLFAVVFWIIVVNVDDPTVTNTITGIPVTTVDEDAITAQNQVFSVVSGETASISVKGPRSIIDKLGRDDFVAEAPFSEKSNVDAVPIYVKFRNSKYEKTVEITQKTMTMKLDVENIVSKTYEIAINHKSEVTTGYTLGKESLSQSTVTVSAPESVINLISRVQVDVELSGRTDDFNEELPIKYYTETGSIINLGENATTSIDTTILSTTLFIIKEVPLKFGSVGTVADGYELVEIVPEKKTLRIAGDNVDSIENIVFPDELINVDKADSDVTVELDVGGQLPGGIMLVDEENDSKVRVTAKVEKLVSSTYRLPVGEIRMDNIPEGFDAEFESQSINVEIEGLQAVQDEFDIDNIEAYVDLKNSREGSNEVIVRMSLPTGLSLTGQVTVGVTLKANKVEETTTAAIETTTKQEETTTSTPETTTIEEETTEEETTTSGKKK